MTAGASGYLLKDSLDDQLLTAVRTIHNGDSVFSSDVTKILANLEPVDKESERTLDLLTP